MSHESQRTSESRQTEIIAGLQTVWKREKSRQGLTQSAVAEKLGMTQASFSQYLSGKTPVSMKLLVRLCNVLRVPPQDIFPGISDLLPNRRHFMVKHKISDVDSQLDEVLTHNPSLEFTMILVDKTIHWKTEEGDEMTAPEGTSLLCVELKEDGNWDRNKIIEAKFFVIHEVGAKHWRIVCRPAFNKLTKESKLIKAYIVIALRLH
jgi:transcriptional regulator with XRE-family HTH domain